MSKKIDYLSVSTISAAHFAHDIYSHFLSPVLPVIIQNLGISYSQAGLLSVFHRFPALFNPLIGQYAAGKNTAIILAVSIIVTALSMCFITAAPSYLILSSLILVMGISACFFHIPSPVMIRKYSGEKTGTGMSFYMFGGEMARGLGPVVVLAAISLWGPKRVYFLLPIAVIMAVILLLKFRKNGDRNKNTHLTGCTEEGFFRVLIRQKAFFFPVLMIMLAKASIASVLNGFLPAYLTSTGVSLWFSGISLSILQLSAAAGTMLAGPVSDRLGKNNTLLAISAVSPFLMFMLIFTDGTLKMIFIILTGFLAFSSSPVVMACVQEESGKSPTVCSSIYMLIDFMTISVTLIFAGIAGDFFGLKNAFICCGILSALGFPFVLCIRKKRLQQS